MTAVEDRPRTARASRVRARPRRSAGTTGSAGRAARKRVRSTTDVILACTSGIIALLIGWFVLYALVLSGLQHRHNQQVLYAQFREQLVGQTEHAPLGGIIEPGVPVALISAPVAGLADEVVVEGTAAGDLENGPGHTRSTALPGQAGVSVLLGRSTLFGGPFGDLASLHAGDEITTTTAQGTATFVVVDVRHAGDPIPGSLAGVQARLTLVTAEASGWRQGWAPRRAVYVDASIKGTAFPAPGGQIATVPKAEQAMQTDPSALPYLVLWLPVLALALAAVVWAQERWGRWQTWLVGAPVLLGCLWGVSQTAVRLLPNLS